MKPRSEWTQEDFAKAIARRRARAKTLRKAAERADADAEQLRKESAALSTEKLPLFDHATG